MTTRPLDTTSEAWRVQRDIVRRMDGDARLRTAIELSDAVRAIQIEGLLARHPAWSRADAVRHLVRAQWGIELEEAS